MVPESASDPTPALPPDDRLVTPSSLQLTAAGAPVPLSDAYARRRAQVLQQMRQAEKEGGGGGAVALVASAPALLRPHDAPWDYRQDSDLYYLTGCEESQVVCLLTTDPPADRPDEHFVVFIAPHDAEADRWAGPRLGMEGARTVLGADAAYPLEALDDLLPVYLQAATTIHCAFDRDEEWHEQLWRLIRRARSLAYRRALGPTRVHDLGLLLDELRLIKDTDEQHLLRTAGAITAAAHRQVMQKTWVNQYEYELQALLEYDFHRHGARRVAYPSIVGSGSNAMILHYEANTRKMCAGELVLVDAGAEYGYYAMDLTRTIPVNGRFTPAQRQLYTIVLAAQEAALAQVRPGQTLEDVHAAAVHVITAGLVEVGLLQGDITQLIASGAYMPYFMHGSSHWIGLDLRDRGSYFPQGQPRRLEPGMICTVEPGLYIGDHIDREALSTDAADVYRNSGIRIEDTVLVSEQGCEVLTAAAPKHPDEIEALMASTASAHE